MAADPLGLRLGSSGRGELASENIDRNLASDVIKPADVGGLHGTTGPMIEERPSPGKSPGNEGNTVEGDSEGQALARLTRKIAHDMNNLITGIFGHAELAAMTPGLSEDVRANLQGVIDASTRASHLATQLLILGRRVTSEPAKMDLAAAVDLACQVLRNQLPPSVGLHFERPEERFGIDADPSEIHQMVLNLCQNGCDAIGGARGKISLSLRQTSFDEAALGAQILEGWKPSAGAFVALTVHDTGRGIHIQALPRIFEPFFSTKGSIGTGLGLTIVQRLVIALGGFVEVKTFLGAGSTFTVYLPVQPNG